MGPTAFISIGINQTQGTRLYMNPIKLSHEERLRAKILSHQAKNRHEIRVLTNWFMHKYGYIKLIVNTVG